MFNLSNSLQNQRKSVSWFRSVNSLLPSSAKAGERWLMRNPHDISFPRHTEAVSLSAEDAAHLKRLLALFDTTEDEVIRPSLGKVVLGRDDDLRDKAMQISLARTKRLQLLPPTLFGEPAWDILIELYLASGRERVTVGKLAEKCRTPNTTILRWINHMKDKGLVTIVQSPFDARARFVDLTDHAMQIMRFYLSEIKVS